MIPAPSLRPFVRLCMFIRRLPYRIEVYGSLRAGGFDRQRAYVHARHALSAGDPVVVAGITSSWGEQSA